MSNYSRCAVCSGVGIAAIGLYLTIIIPLIATDRLSYVIGLSNALQNISIIIAVVAALPYILRLYKYYSWEPKVYILYQDGIKIVCGKSSKETYIRLEFMFPDGVNEKTINITKKLMEKNLIERDETTEAYIPVGRLDSLKGKEILLLPNTTRGFGVELEPETKMRVRLYPRVHLSEFHIPIFGEPWPRFYGDVELKPIDRTIRLDSSGNLEESNRRWIEREYATTDDNALE